jgi:hypothetical protein
MSGRPLFVFQSTSRLYCLLLFTLNDNVPGNAPARCVMAT